MIDYILFYLFILAIAFVLVLVVAWTVKAESKIMRERMDEYRKK